MQHPRDIEAEIRFFRTDEGGRKGPARTGYRPQFYYHGHDWDAVHEYPDCEWVYPGDTITAYLAFLSPEAHVGRLAPGTVFQIREGAKVVAEGRVTKLLELEQSARRSQESHKSSAERRFSSLSRRSSKVSR